MRAAARGEAGSSAAIARRLGADSCGCAMGARFLGVGLLSSIAWYGWHWQSSELSFWGVSWRIMLISFVAAAAGKILGMIVFRMGIRADPRSRMEAEA
jgi:hypothetical protein